ncbi:MAG: hypothetical protein KKB22_01475 [Candidatus Omnitrophica bacterium]|nr:hypothetical protein [Candidatus Omnitrophota bacterium]
MKKAPNKNQKLFFLKKKLILLAFIIIIAVCLIESGLRIGGYIVLKLNPPLNPLSGIKNENKFIILCLGDSYTFGLGTTYQYSYPRQLERILNGRFSNNNFEVYNLGVPGSNSSQLANNMQYNINKYHPDLLIIMTGRNDAWNLTDVTNVLLSNKIDSILAHLKIYKLVKIIAINLRGRVNFENTVISKVAIEANLAADHNNRDNKNIKIQKDILPEASQQIVTGHNFAAQARYDLAEKCFLKALELDPHNVSANRQLGAIYREQAKYESAEECLKKSLAREDGTKDLGAYLELGMIHRLKGKYGLAKQELKEAMADPQQLYLAFNELFQLYKDGEEFFNDIENFKKQIKNQEIFAKLDLLLKLKKDEEVVYRILYANLIKIKEISKINNLVVIYQTYPNPDIDAINENIRKFAKRYNALLADNYLIFKEKLTNQNKKDFFVADEHCNAKGYRIIAQNIYLTLLKERIINNVINEGPTN